MTKALAYQTYLPLADGVRAYGIPTSDVSTNTWILVGNIWAENTTDGYVPDKILHLEFTTMINNELSSTQLLIYPSYYDGTSFPASISAYYTGKSVPPLVFQTTFMSSVNASGAGIYFVYCQFQPNMAGCGVSVLSRSSFTFYGAKKGISEPISQGRLSQRLYITLTIHLMLQQLYRHL